MFEAIVSYLTPGEIACAKMTCRATRNMMRPSFAQLAVRSQDPRDRFLIACAIECPESRCLQCSLSLKSHPLDWFHESIIGKEPRDRACLRYAYRSMKFANTNLNLTNVHLFRETLEGAANEAPPNFRTRISLSRCQHSTSFGRALQFPQLTLSRRWPLGYWEYP